jgi:hypothetical protein
LVVAVVVPQFRCPNDRIDDVPDAKAAEGDQFKQAENNFPFVKTVCSNVTQSPTENCSGQQVPAIIHIQQLLKKSYLAALMLIENRLKVKMALSK